MTWVGRYGDAVAPQPFRRDGHGPPRGDRRQDGYRAMDERKSIKVMVEL
jgi:hypothetical protein